MPLRIGAVVAALQPAAFVAVRAVAAVHHRPPAARPPVLIDVEGHRSAMLHQPRRVDHAPVRPFGIDGIPADEGCLPTKLNARGGTALGRMAEAACLPPAPLRLAVSQGERLDYRSVGPEEMSGTAHTGSTPLVPFGRERQEANSVPANESPLKVLKHRHPR